MALRPVFVYLCWFEVVHYPLSSHKARLHFYYYYCCPYCQQRGGARSQHPKARLGGAGAEGGVWVGVGAVFGAGPAVDESVERGGDSEREGAGERRGRSVKMAAPDQKSFVSSGVAASWRAEPPVVLTFESEEVSDSPGSHVTAPTTVVSVEIDTSLELVAVRGYWPKVHPWKDWMLSSSWPDTGRQPQTELLRVGAK